RSVLASAYPEFEVVVLDDDSTDRTAAIVQELALADPRVRLLRAPPLPDDWNGKQHACWHLAQAASNERLMFIDADVRLEPTAVQRLVLQQDLTGCSLLSGFPRQITLSTAEQLLIPLMY